MCTCTCLVPRDQKKLSDPPELELQMVMNPHVVPRI